MPIRPDTLRISEKGSFSSRGPSTILFAHQASLNITYPLEPLTKNTTIFMPLTRKRAASLDVGAANESPVPDVAPASAGTDDNLREQICLCQPDPKIPRPRNAFILYRQHTQAQVVAQNPGLANPEISKIIGDQWKSQPSEVKNSWKQLANEEKQRHQRQYPGYRYQPRRLVKADGLSPVSVLSDRISTHCHKCGGRYISTPSTPLTPFTPSFRMSKPSDDNGLPNSHHSSQTMEIEQFSPRARLEHLQISSPTSARFKGQVDPRQRHSSSLPTHYENEDETEMHDISQNQKRRRFSPGHHDPLPSTSQYAQSPGGATSTTLRQSNVLPTSGLRRQHDSRYGAAQTGASLQHSPQSRSTTNSSTSGGHPNDSLHLPPLQTQQISPSSTAPQQQSANATTARGGGAHVYWPPMLTVEGTVVSIAYPNKVKLLTRIAPPLALSSSFEQHAMTRGCVIAVEGHEQRLLQVIGRFIEKTLQADNDIALRCWNTFPRGASFSRVAATSSSDVEATKLSLLSRDAVLRDGTDDTNGTNLPMDVKADPFTEYLSIITEMHRSSVEIIQHVTTTLFSPRNATLHVRTRNQNLMQNQNRKKLTPVALLPYGFSITASDIFAQRIPINDNYAPIDHWQWLATMFRGIVGPDLTICCVGTSMEDIARYGGVEVREGGVIMVRVPEDKGDKSGKITNKEPNNDEYEIDEKTARRLSFEVLEFIRNLEGDSKSS